MRDGGSMLVSQGRVNEARYESQTSQDCAPAFIQPQSLANISRRWLNAVPFHLECSRELPTV